MFRGPYSLSSVFFVSYFSFTLSRTGRGGLPGECDAHVTVRLVAHAVSRGVSSPVLHVVLGVWIERLLFAAAFHHLLESTGCGGEVVRYGSDSGCRVVFLPTTGGKCLCSFLQGAATYDL